MASASSSSSATSGSSKPKVFILGASGLVGQATLRALNHECKGMCEVKAGTRDTEEFMEHQSSAASATSVKHADMADRKSLVPKLVGSDAVFIVVPGDEHRSEITTSVIDASVEAKVKFVLLVSITTAGTPTIFGRQFGEIEDYVKKSSLPSWCILRLPMFIDNWLHFAERIMSTKSIGAPVKADIPFTPVAVKDIGCVAAKILASYSNYNKKTLTLALDNPVTYNQIVDSFSKVLGTKISFKELSDADFKDALIQRGVSQVETNGIVEYYNFIRENKKEFICTPNSTIKDITGKPATTVEEWVFMHKAVFTSGAAA